MPELSPELSIVIPAHDEEQNIRVLIEEVVGVLAALIDPPSYEIIVVDDGSTDGTRAQVKAAMAHLAMLRFLTHGARAGKSAALVSGFTAARGPWIATLDGDGQNDPADLARLWPEIASAPNTVIFAGVRARRNDGFVKFLTSKIANPIRRTLLNDTARDSGCGFKVMPAAFAKRLPYFDNMHRFFPALARREGLDVREMVIEDRARLHGVSKYGFFDRAAVAFLDVVGVHWLNRRYSHRGGVTEHAVNAVPLETASAPKKLSVK